MSAPERMMAFQLAFGKHLRNPESVPCPAGIPARRALIYQELLFNNLRGFIDTCFPVSKQMLEPERWTALARAFFCQWRCHTPYFNEIPREFINYVAENAPAENLPEWLPALLHYEWIELDVELQTAPDIAEQTLTDKPALKVNPTLRNVSYEWPVHRISRQHVPTEKELTCLLVYRDRDYRVQFMAVNPVTARMIALAESANHDADSLLNAIIAELQAPNPDLIRQFGRQQIEEFIHHGILTEDQ